MADESDPIRALIRAKLKERGLDMAYVSKEILGHNHAYLQQFLSRGVPRKLEEDDRAALSKALGVPEDDLKLGSELSSVRPAPLAPKPPAMERENRDVPVWGTVEGGPHGAFEIYYSSDPVDYVTRPAGIEKARKVYALFVVGESMVPAYQPGELIYVNPAKPPSIGCDVVIQIRPDHEGDAPRYYLKELMRRTATKLICQQHNPRREVTYDLSEVVEIHRVLTLAELVGA